MNDSSDPLNIKQRWFYLSPRECDLLYEIWNGIDPWIAAQKLGISHAAFLSIISKESVKNELEKFYKAVTMSPNERMALLSQLGRDGMHEIS
jgi:hypothetical protein